MQNSKPAVRMRQLSAPANITAGEVSIDLVLSVYTFEHFTNPRLMVAQIRQVLADRGYVYIEAPNGNMLSCHLLKD